MWCEEEKNSLGQTTTHKTKHFQVCSIFFGIHWCPFLLLFVKKDFPSQQQQQQQGQRRQQQQQQQQQQHQQQHFLTLHVGLRD